MSVGPGRLGTGHEVPNHGRSRPQNVDQLFNDNSSITCSLVTIAQVGREEVSRLALPLHKDHGNLHVYATIGVNEARLPELFCEETAA